MLPEEKARKVIDKKLEQSGWIVQDLKKINLIAAQGVAVREFPTDTGEADYTLFVDGLPVGVIEAKKSEIGENLTVVEQQSVRYAKSKFKWIDREYRIRFAYEATDKIIRFTDYDDIKYRSRTVFSFHRPETLKQLLTQMDTVRNNLKSFPPLNTQGFRDCQVRAIRNLESSFAMSRPKALIQMATGAGKTFIAITAAYRLLKYGKMNRILFLVDTKSLGEQAEREFLAYMPNDDHRSFSSIYGVYRLKSSKMPNDVQIYISTIQRMYSILKGEELDETLEETSLNEYDSLDKEKPKEVVYNTNYPPEFFDCIIVDECHRSIYNVWKQVLEYFDSFIVGLTATPDKRTFAFFDQNVVSEYTREQAIIDGVNVGEDVFLIETNVTKNGAHIMKQILHTFPCNPLIHKIHLPQNTDKKGLVFQYNSCICLKSCPDWKSFPPAVFKIYPVDIRIHHIIQRPSAARPDIRINRPYYPLSSPVFKKRKRRKPVLHLQSGTDFSHILWRNLHFHLKFFSIAWNNIQYLRSRFNIISYIY